MIGVGACAYLDKDGNWVDARDSLDARYIKEFVTNTGITEAITKPGIAPTVGGVAAYKDSDGDGMPDDWEIAHGLNPKNPSDANGDFDNTGFTNLEKFLSGRYGSKRH
jgi:hypothetical protein